MTDKSCRRVVSCPGYPLARLLKARIGNPATPSRPVAAMGQPPKPILGYMYSSSPWILGSRSGGSCLSDWPQALILAKAVRRSLSSRSSRVPYGASTDRAARGGAGGSEPTASDFLVALHPAAGLLAGHLSNTPPPASQAAPRPPAGLVAGYPTERRSAAGARSGSAGRPLSSAGCLPFLGRQAGPPQVVRRLPPAAGCP
jgi:hypothetical protein